jgi:hypothetical protein
MGTVMDLEEYLTRLMGSMIPVLHPSLRMAVAMLVQSYL